MTIKALTLSALTGSALVLAYAARAKWRARQRAPQPSSVDLPLATQLEPPSAPHATKDPGIDIDLSGLWDSEEPPRNPGEQLVDFSSDLAYDNDEDEGAVAPEGLGVRWLSRATEALSPFHHAVSVREEAEAALLEAAMSTQEEDMPPAPPSSDLLPEDEFDVELPSEPDGSWSPAAPPLRPENDANDDLLRNRPAERTRK